MATASSTSTTPTPSSPSSLDEPLCRYVKGGTTKSFSSRLGWWERTIMPFRSDDQIVTVTGRYVGRSDLIASDYLGTTDYEWLVLQYNTILVPNQELVEGAVIRLPVLSRLT